VAPVALSIKVAKIDAILPTKMDVCDGTRNFACDKGAAASRRLVIEEDAIACVHVVGLTIVDNNPEPIKLGDSVR
jgi:hypothetical protein